MDLKPANLMLVPDPLGPGGERIKVLDFGIAKLIADVRQGKTATNAIMGTPVYMSPEQCRGAGEVDSKTDVYSLGCILFETLAGRPPFVAEGSGELMAMHIFQPPPSLREVAPDVPVDIAGVTDSMLRKDRSHRPLMREVAQTLSQLASTQAGALPPESYSALRTVMSPGESRVHHTPFPGPAQTTGHPRGQSSLRGHGRRSLTVAAIVSCSLVVGGVAWLWFSSRSLLKLQNKPGSQAQAIPVTSGTDTLQTSSRSKRNLSTALQPERTGIY